MKKINLLVILFLILVSCNTAKEAGKVLRNEKVTNTDEFLVKKRNPLVLPPDFNKLPEPGTILEKGKSENEEIKRILKAPEKIKNSNKNKSSSIEESILNRIRK